MFELLGAGGIRLAALLVGVAVICDEAREAAVGAVDGAREAQEARIVVHRQHEAVHLVHELLGIGARLQVAAFDRLLRAAQSRF